jgi:very-short-patch-repair endonuclease
VDDGTSDEARGGEHGHRLGYPAPDVEMARALGVLAPASTAEEPLLRRHLRSGRWTRYGRVVVTHNGPLTDEQLVWVAVLRAPRGVVLSGTTAARRRGLDVRRPTQPELLVPAAGPLPHLQGVQVARTRLLTAADVHPTAQPPQLRLPRAVVDAASRAARPDDVRALLCAGVQQRRLRAEDLRHAVLRLGPVRNRALMLRTLDDIEGGSHSVRELQFLRTVRHAGLPAPARQVVRQRLGGRLYLDAAWDAYRLHVEVDGLGHLFVDAWSADLDRANELALRGSNATTLRIPGFWLDERREHVVDQVRRGLLAGGWSPDGRAGVAVRQAA